jgi:methionyl-tRNA formyltransferase
VHRAATALGLDVVELDPGDAGGLAARLASLQPDVVAVAAWSGMLTSKALAQGRLAALNVHASLLPRWRGAAPVERAIMAGDAVTGITIMYMALELDAGDILLQAEMPISAADTGATLTASLADLGGRCLVQSLDMLSTGTAARCPQDPGGVTWAPKLSSEDERITWLMPAPTLVLTVRALSPDPGAHFVHCGRRVKVLAAEAVAAPTGATAPPAAPGTVLGIDGRSGSLTVCLAEGAAARILRVKPAGGREMSGAAYAFGRRLGPGDRVSE